MVVISTSLFAAISAPSSRCWRSFNSADRFLMSNKIVFLAFTPSGVRLFSFFLQQYVILLTVQHAAFAFSRLLHTVVGAVASPPSAIASSLHGGASPYLRVTLFSQNSPALHPPPSQTPPLITAVINQYTIFDHYTSQPRHTCHRDSVSSSSCFVYASSSDTMRDVEPMQRPSSK